MKTKKNNQYLIKSSFKSVIFSSQAQEKASEDILIMLHLACKLNFHHKLTAREKSIIYWIAQGKKSSEIASTMKIKEDTLKAYRRDIKRKLNCKTFHQAMFKSITCELIQRDS